MKYFKKIPFYLVLLFLAACNSPYQVIETSSTSVNFQGENYEYEDEKLKITYDLWKENGMLAFTIYNKSTKPLYIDWSKSSFILGTDSYKYWNDETIENSSIKIETTDRSYRFKENVKVSEGDITSTSTKAQKIILIEPQTKISGTYSNALQNRYFKLKNEGSSIMVANNSKPKKLTEVYIEDFDTKNSPLHFRNFLNFASKSDFGDEFFIDTEFYVKKIQVMEKKHFKHRVVANSASDPSFSYPFEQSNSFFIKLPN